MFLFLFVFLLVYTGMNILVFIKVRVLLSNCRGALYSFGIFLLFMILAPIGARLLERSDHESLAQVTAFMGYPWMGFVFLSFCAFFLTGTLDLFIGLLNSFAGVHIPSFAGRMPTMVVLGVVATLCVYGFFEAHSIRTERVSVMTRKLPETVAHLKIAQVSDVHLGLLFGRRRLKKIIDTVRLEEPDILVCTGDLVDGNIVGKEEILELLKSIRPPYGKYAVTGNHEFYAGLNQSLETISRAGFEVLRGQAANVHDIINVVGVDDPAAGSTVYEAALLSSFRNGRFTLFLKHRPEAARESLGLFDLQLSGHAHRGQIFPFRYFTGMVYPMQDGLHDLEGGSKLYTSRGSGTWGPPMRILSPPEVTIIDLVRE